MKKGTILFSLILLVVVVLSSCKKDWTCMCSPTPQSNDDNADYYAILNETKKNAENICYLKGFEYGYDACSLH